MRGKAFLGGAAMNIARIAQLLRASARLQEELAAEFENRPSAHDNERRKRPRTVSPIVPASMPNEIDMARARQQLQKLGYRIGAKR
jgi:hypothetical protein